MKVNHTAAIPISEGERSLDLSACTRGKKAIAKIGRSGIAFSKAAKRECRIIKKLPAITALQLIRDEDRFLPP
jgi:hypothetical protein